MSLNKRQKDLVEKLYFEMCHKLIIYAQSVLRDPLQSQEAVQDTFRIACAKANDLLSSKNPKGWLFNTLKYVIKNIQYSTARYNYLLLNVDINTYFENTDGINDEISVDLLYSNLADSEEYKLIRMIALEKKTMLETAQKLGISVEACKKRVQRARKKLQKLFRKKINVPKT